MQTLDPETAADSLEQSSDAVAAEAVAILEEGEVQPILEAMDADRRAALERSVSPELARQWKINTEFDEDYPFLHPNGITLYFSSKGHNSMV